MCSDYRSFPRSGVERIPRRSSVGESQPTSIPIRSHITEIRDYHDRQISHAAILASATLVNAAHAEEKKDYPFFPFCIDWHDAKKRNFEEQAVMLKELGYDGVGHIWLDKVAERLKTLDAKGLKLYQITMKVNVAPGQAGLRSALQGRSRAGQRAERAVLPARKRRQAVRSLARSAGGESLREMSDLAADSGAQLLLYPQRAIGWSGSRIRSAWPRRWIARTSA